MQLHISENSGFSARSILIGVIGAVCLSGVIGGLIVWHHEKKIKSAFQLSDRYFQALEGKDSQKIFSALSESKNRKIAEYATIHASDSVRKEHLEAQAKNFLSPENFKEEPLKGLALMMSLNLRASQLEEADSEQEILGLREGYQKLANSSPAWADFAREGMVSLDLRKGASASDKAEAVRLLREIEASPNALSGMRQRADLLLQALES